jgi:hypothetical protein
MIDFREGFKCMSNEQENQMLPPDGSPAPLALVSGTTASIGLAVARQLVAGSRKVQTK